MGISRLPDAWISQFFVTRYPDTLVSPILLSSIRYFDTALDQGLRLLVWLGELFATLLVAQGGQTIYAPLDYRSFWLLRPISPQCLRGHT